MNRGLYSSASGMVAAQQLLDLVTNNLANASTNGFKQDGISFANAMDRELSSSGVPIGTLGTGAAVAAQYTDFSAGSIISTGNPLDLAISSTKGAFAVQINPSTVAYTRDGAFALNENRQLVTKQGYPVLGQDMKPIQIPQGEVRIAENGEVSVAGQPAGRIGVFDGNFQKTGENLFTASGAPVSQTPVLATRSIESSNVNPIEAMIQMIALNRNFELAQKSATQHDTLTQQLIQSLQQ